MTFIEIQEAAFYQTGNDAEDIVEFRPHIGAYINEGYDDLKFAISGEHPVSLTLDTDAPDLPEWLHRSLADYASWLLYRNGNPQRQQRGYAFKGNYDIAKARAVRSGGKIEFAHLYD